MASERYSAVTSEINSEIHASLRRLEDADYANEVAQQRSLSIMADEVDSVDQRLSSLVEGLHSEVYKLHDYMETHISQGDLRLFQNLDVGNIQVTDGGEFSGAVRFNNDIVMSDSFTYSPHALTIEGSQAAEKILATGDITFSLAGLIQGDWLGMTSSGNTATRTYSVTGVRSGTQLLSEILTIEPFNVYDPDTHRYKASARVTDSNNYIILSSGVALSDDQAYQDGGGGQSQTVYPPNSATFEWFETVGGEPHFRRTGGDFFGRTSRTVYWDDDE